MGDLPLMELLSFAAAGIAVGLVAGILAGVFGIGGGAVMVPVFYQALGAIGVDESVRMHIAVGTSLAIIVPTSLRSFQAHYRRNAVDTALLKSFLIPVPAGVVLASLVAAAISSAGLRAIFGCIAIVVALRLLLNREHWRIGSEIPGNPVRAIVGLVLGFLSTLMGIGGGVLNNTFMTVFGRPMHQAVATSSGVGVLISIPGVLGYVWAGWGDPNLPLGSTGFVNWIAVACIIPVTMLAAPLGVRVAHAVSKRQLEIAFGIFLLIVAARFFFSLT
ncbi:MAG: sulfite exporter TauE/SafE family protein [Zhengella sp.]|uniref:sulfite exporter TauE/SafE family protein n=1 Tax=Zhengella sp. TaxID=2282762 RepID=UPI001DE8F50F|nr:sulfite exporter TauE/SafE family protein [Notoacmeibacter sp.]MCC0027292.1 sulfite exporter TauE/SafE family protein [Brucellaceae bacterium]